MAQQFKKKKKKRPACQYWRHSFNPWPRKNPWAAEQLSLRATTTEPVLWGPGVTVTEARVHPRTYAAQEKPHNSEKPAHPNQEEPPLAITREKPHSNKDSAQPQIKK